MIMEVTSQLKSIIWNKGKLIENYDRNVWRRDMYGRAMKYTEYGKRDSEYGWEIDHIKQVQFGGTDDMNNLRPLNWKSNVKR